MESTDTSTTRSTEEKASSPKKGQRSGDSSPPEPPPPPKRRRRRRTSNRIAMISTHGYVAAEPPLGAPDTGGQVVYLLELSRKLAELGYKVDIWTRQFEDQPAEEEVDDHVRILRMPCGGSDFIPKEYLYHKLPEWGEHALRYIRKNNLKYQFIDSHYWDAGIAGQRLAQVLDIPHIHTPHSLGAWKKQKMEEDFPEDKDTFEETYNFSERIHHETMLYRDCDALIATSPMQVDVIRKSYSTAKTKVHMIPPGYDDSRFYPVGEAMREQLREELGYEGPTVACVGRLSRNKGFDLLIEAFAVAAERIPDAHLRLAVGREDEESTEDPMLEELYGLVDQYGIKDRVTIAGSLPDEAMADFYRCADVFTLPSRYEPFGMTAVEAIACGTPTVLTTNGGLYRTMAYGIESLYADPLDKEDFGITIMKALRHGDIRKRLSLHGARKVRSLFTWTGIAQQLVRLVEGLVTPSLMLVDSNGE